MRDAGITGITLPREAVLIMTLNRQNNLTNQKTANFLTLMLISFPSGPAPLPGLKENPQCALQLPVTNTYR